MRIGRVGKALFTAAATAALSTPGFALADSGPAKAVTTAVTCPVSGTVSISAIGVPGAGVNYLPRDLTVSGSDSSGACVDLRSDKSATGGHSIVGYSDTFTGFFPNSSCESAGGTLIVEIAWSLDDGSTVTSTVTETIPQGNIFENIPGSGTVTDAPFSGALFESNALLHNPVDHALTCATQRGVTGSTYTSTVALVR